MATQTLEITYESISNTLDEDDPSSRQKVLHSLIRRGSRSLRAMTQLLNDLDQRSVRSTYGTVEVLEDAWRQIAIRNPEAVKELLEGEDAGIQVTTARLIESKFLPDLSPLLIPLIREDQDPMVLAEALYTVGLYRDRIKRGWVLRALPETATSTLELMEAIDPTLINSAVLKLLSGNFEYVTSIVSVPAGDPEIQKRSHLSRIQECAIHSAGHLHAQAAIPLLMKMIEPQSRRHEPAAMMALAQMQAAVAIPVILDLATEQMISGRQLAALALGIMGSDEGVETLLKLTDDTDARVRETACQSLGMIASTTAKSALQLCLKHRDGVVRVAANKALKVISRQSC